MNTLIYSIAFEKIAETVKLSSSRARKDIIKFLVRRGGNKRALRNANPQELADAVMFAKKPGIDMDYLHFERLAELEREARKAFPDLVKRTANRPLSKAEAAKFRADAKRHFSGRHKPKPGEEFIESYGTPEIAVGKASDQYLYRGNPLHVDESADLTKSLNFASRHPDVAAGYAAQGTAQYSPLSNKLYRYNYPANKLYVRRNIPTGSVVRVPSKLTPEQASSHRSVMRAVERSMSRGKELPTVGRYRPLAKGKRGRVKKILDPANEGAFNVNPTYETAFSSKDKRALELLGEPTEFAVRKARTQDGRIGFALRRTT